MMMMLPARRGDAARNAGMSPLRYSNMFVRNRFHDEVSGRRIFNPMWLALSPVTVENLTIYDDRAGTTHTRFGAARGREWRADPHTLLVSVRGICKNCNGTPDSAARAAIGVYFGPDSPHNFAVRVPARLPQTRRFAEIFAVRMALRRVRDRWHDDDSISTVHVVTDSDYVVAALTEDIDEWRINGFRDDEGEKIANHSEIEKLDLLMLELAKDGISPSFWPVDRRENREANMLAKDALGLLRH